MSVHPTIFFGPAVLCEPFMTEKENELYSCYNENCNNYKHKYMREEFCSKCGGKLTTQTFKISVPFNSYSLTDEMEDFDLESVPWYEDRNDFDYYIGESIKSIDCDYEEIQCVLSIDDIQKNINEFKTKYAKEIEILNKVYNGKVRVELVLLNWIN